MQATNSMKTYLLFVILILIWGLGWPVNKIGIQFVPPIWFASIRLIIGTLAIFILVGALGKLIFPTKKDLPLIFSVGIFQIGIIQIFMNFGLVYVDAGRSAILTYTSPLWVLPMTILFFHEKTNWLNWSGFIIGMVGVLLLFGPWSMVWSSRSIMGNGYLMLGAFFLALSIICARYLKWYHTPLELMPWQMLVGTIPILVIAALTASHPIIAWNAAAWLTLTYTGVFASAIGYWIFSLISKELPSIMVSIGFLGVPVSGLMFSHFMLNEPITLTTGVAIFLLTAGIFCVALGSRKKIHKSITTL